MNKQMTISIISVLAIGVIVAGILYAQETNKLRDAQSEIVTLEENVSALESNGSVLKGEISALETGLAASEAEGLTLESNVSVLEGDISALETELAASEAEVSTLEGDLAAEEARSSTLETEVSTLEGDLAAEEVWVSTLEAYLADLLAEPLTIDHVADHVRRYLEDVYGGGLVLVHIMEFVENFYAEVVEEDSGIHAMELLIDKYTGQVFPEMGPNMMWNEKYGMHPSGRSGLDMPITPEQAESIAQQFLDANMPGVTVGEVATFYGYYTLHILRNGQVVGMLSVNGYTPEVWYHDWHGPFIGMEEFE